MDIFPAVVIGERDHAAARRPGLELHGEGGQRTAIGVSVFDFRRVVRIDNKCRHGAVSGEMDPQRTVAFGTFLATGILQAVNTETVRLPTVFTLRNYAFAVSVVATASTLSALVVLRTLKNLDLVSALKAPE